jgi:hypothetical protein
MSIAVSAVVRPSRLLMLLSAAMSIVLMAAATLLVLAADERLHHALAVVCAIASVAVVLFLLHGRKAFRIDITGLGQIRLVDTSLIAEAKLTTSSLGGGEVVQLLRGSTFWSSLMVLCLQSDSGRITVLIIFPDSTDCDAFRSLSVACRWIAARQSCHAAMPGDISPRSD